MDPIKIETPIGPMELIPQGLSTWKGNNGHTVYVDLAPDLKTPEGTRAYDSTGSHYSCVTIRGVQYRGSAHLYQWDDGLFHIGKQWIIPTTPGIPIRLATCYDTRESLFMSKPGKFGNDDKVSSSAREACKLAIERAVNDYFKHRAYLLVAAEIERLETSLGHLQTKRTEALEVLTGIERDIIKTKQALEFQTTQGTK